MNRQFRQALSSWEGVWAGAAGPDPQTPTALRAAGIAREAGTQSRTRGHEAPSVVVHASVSNATPSTRGRDRLQPYDHLRLRALSTVRQDMMTFMADVSLDACLENLSIPV